MEEFAKLVNCFFCGIKHSTEVDGDMKSLYLKYDIDTFQPYNLITQKLSASPQNFPQKVTQLY